MEQPVVFNEVLNLLSVGVNPDYVKFGTTSMESDKFITVCEQTNGQSNVVIIDLYQNNNVQKRPISAEAAIMNPVSKVIALRAGNQLQIFNMELRAKMKSHQISESVVYWRWISPNMIGLVTATSIYHWSIEGDSAPLKIFERNASIGTGNQIIGYEVSDDTNWCLLIGIAQGEGGTIVGNMQLYSKEKKVSQVLNGYAGSFTTLNLPGRTDPAQVLCFAGSKAGGPLQLFIMEVGRDKDAPGGVFRLPPQPIPFPPEAVADFPVSMIDTSDGLVYIISKMGFLYLFDIYTGKPIYRCRISQDTVFVSTINTKTRGILGITRKGQVLHIALNKKTLAPYIVTTLHDPQLAISLAGRIDLPGVEELYFTEFNRLLSVNDIQGAAKLASASPQGILRTPQTIQRFQAMPAQPGQPQPALQYFSVLLEKGGLNKHESMELARPVLQQGRGQLLEKWLTENKLECSEELGDMIAQSDTNMALSVYLRAQVPEKVINCFIQRGEYEKIVAYALQTGYKCDYTFMLQSLVRANPSGALDFATKLANAENGSLIDIAAVVDIFMQVNRIQETTAFLLEALKQNRPEDARLQTRLLEINLAGGSPQVAEAILSNNMFTHYDRQRVGQLCEKAQLFQRALEHYTEFDDIKRVIANTHAINQEFLVSYFSGLTSEVSMKLINILLSTNLRQNLNVVVQIATKYAEQLGTNLLIETFEKYKSYDGLYFFLGAIVNFSQDAEVHYRYIEAATKMGQFKEVERVCRDSTVYDPVKVKDFLKESKLQDPRPLIHVCDRYEYIEELTQYLYSNQLLKYIEVYATKVSPQKTPKVIGKLLDLDSNEDYIRSLLNAIPIQQCPVEELVNEVEKRNRLRLLQPYLELLVQQGNTETATHNAIGKIYITLNKDPQNFLTNNQYYDPLVVGRFCEKLDPHLAYLAYRRNGGQCDAELIRITKENGLYKELARYLVEKQDLDLWAKVLVKPEDEENEKENASRGLLIDQVVQTALSETKNADEVSTTVRAFMNADLPNELIELLERIVLQNTDFSNNKNLQNLLILTAIKANQEKVMDYINRLDNYDGPDIAKIAINEQYKLYEEAFVIYKKTGENNDDAIDVLLDYIGDMERAYEFADRCNEPGVWSRLATKQLSMSDGFNESIQSFIKAQDAASYANVISKGEADDKYEEMIPYLKMARQMVKEQLIDTTLIYALSKTKKYHDLEEFISSPNIAQIQEIGEKCYNEQLYDAAKILFRNINNNAKLSICYVRTGNYREAVDAATKANSINTWKEICYACIDVGEFRLANLCGLHIIVHPDHLEELIQNYEKMGYWNELIKLLEQGIGLDGTHVGIFTELGILYSRYLPDKLMEHIKIFHGRINISKILRFCEKALLWDHMVYLYKEDNQYDNAVRIMIEHSVAFNNETFLDCVQKVRNHEIHYKAIQFYIECFPLDLNRLLTLLIPNLDHARVIHQIRKVNKDYLLLITDYLHEIQKENLNAINDTINEIYIGNEEYALLKESIETYNNFDQISLAQKLEKHELLEFRRLSALLYQKNKRFTQSIKISKDDKIYKDIITTIALSKDTAIIEDTIQYFIDLNERECIVAILYQCYQYIEPDYIMEIGWKYDLLDFTMPYMIQYMKNSNRKIKELQERCHTLEEKNKQNTQGSTIESQNANLGGALGGGMMQIAATAFNPNDMNSGYMMPPQQQMGGGMGIMQPNLGGVSPMTMPGMSPQTQMGPPGSNAGFNTFNNPQGYRY